MPDIPDIGFLLTLKPEEAIKYFQKKGYTFSWDWKDTWQEANSKAFTVAKGMRLDIIQDIQNGVDKALNDGTTYEDFKRELKPILKSDGWWGKVAAKDVPGYNTENGGDPNKEVQLGSPRRLETIYRTNIRTSVAVGRYKDQIDQSDERPYWMWVQVDRPNKRPMHAKLNGMVLRWDDPFWDTCYPPNGFGCECHIRALTKAEVKDMGLKVISGDAISFTPDPSWDYNPGKEFYYPDLNKYDYDVAKQWVKGGLTGKDFKGFMDQEVNGNFPVAVLDQEYQDLIGAKTKVVNFSDESRDKNITNHPELTINDYINLPTSISDANVIIQKGDQNLIFIKKDNKIYFSVIKSTESGDELYLTSFRLSNEKDMKNEMGKGSVIKNDL